MRAHHKQSFPLSSHRFDVRHLGAFPALATHRLIGFTSSTIIGVFFPIFLYEFLGMNLASFFLWFAIGMVLRLPLFVWAAKIFSRTGLRVSIVVGVVMWAVYYFGAYLLNVQPDFYPSVVLFLTFLSLALCHAFYWVPFHVDFATFGKKGRRGRELGVLYALQRLLSVVGPILGGWIIATYSYDAAFVVGIVVALASLVPVMSFPKVHVQYEFGFFESFAKLFSGKYRYLTLSMIALGVESIVAYAMWPVFLFVVFAGDYLDVGIFSSAIVAIGMILQVFMGRLTDRKKPKALLRFGVDVYSLGWIAKGLVSSVAGVFAASTFHMFGSILMSTPLDAMFYDKAADSGHYVDEFTTIREIALTVGRAGALLAMFALSFAFSISIAFWIAGIASLAITLFAQVKVGEELV